MHPRKKEVKQGILGVRLEHIHQVGGGSFPLRSHEGETLWQATLFSSREGCLWSVLPWKPPGICQ